MSDSSSSLSTFHVSAPSGGSKSSSKSVRRAYLPPSTYELDAKQSDSQSQDAFERRIGEILQKPLTSTWDRHSQYPAPFSHPSGVGASTRTGAHSKLIMDGENTIVNNHSFKAAKSAKQQQIKQTYIQSSKSKKPSHSSTMHTSSSQSFLPPVQGALPPPAHFPSTLPNSSFPQFSPTGVVMPSNMSGSPPSSVVPPGAYWGVGVPVSGGAMPYPPAAFPYPPHYAPQHNQTQPGLPNLMAWVKGVLKYDPAANNEIRAYENGQISNEEMESYLTARYMAEQQRFQQEHLRQYQQAQAAHQHAAALSQPSSSYHPSSSQPVNGVNDSSRSATPTSSSALALTWSNNNNNNNQTSAPRTANDGIVIVKKRDEKKELEKQREKEREEKEASVAKEEKEKALLAQHESEMLKKQQALDEQQRAIVLKQPAKKPVNVPSSAAPVVLESFDFLVSPLPGRSPPLHQSYADPLNTAPGPLPIFPTSIYVNQQNAQPLLPPKRFTDKDVDLSSDQVDQQREELQFESSHLTSFEDVKINGSKISSDLDVSPQSPFPPQSLHSQKVLINLSGKDLPSDRNLFYFVSKKQEQNVITLPTSGTSSTQVTTDTLLSGQSNWEVIGCTELQKDSNPHFERTFIVDAPKIMSNPILQVHEHGRTQSIFKGEEMNWSALNSKDADTESMKHKLHAGGHDLTRTALKIQLVHIPSDVLSNLPPDVHLYKSLPVGADILGECVVPLLNILDLPTQEFKFLPLPLTASQIQTLQKRRSMERSSNVGPLIHTQLGSLHIIAKSVGLLTPIDLQATCLNLPVSEWMHKCDPVVVLYASNPNTGRFSYISSTERFRSTPSPAFIKQITVFSFSQCDRLLRLAVYDADQHLNINEKDLLGEIFVSLDELIQAHQSNQSKFEASNGKIANDQLFKNTINFRLMNRKIPVASHNQPSLLHLTSSIRPVHVQAGESPAQTEFEKAAKPLALTDPSQATMSIVEQLQRQLVPEPTSQSNSLPIDQTLDADADVDFLRGGSYPLQLSLSCSGLPKCASTSKCDPIVVIFVATVQDGKTVWKVLGQTERAVNTASPHYRRLLTCKFHPHMSESRDIRIAVYDSNETDHIRYNNEDASMVQNQNLEYFIHEHHLIGEHFLTLHHLIDRLQSEQSDVDLIDRKLELDVMKYGRPVLKRKVAGEPDGGSAKFLIQVLNLDQIPKLTKLQDLITQPNDAVDQLLVLKQATSALSAAGLPDYSGYSQDPAQDHTGLSQISMSLSCRGLLKKHYDAIAPTATNPLIAVYITNPHSGVFEFFGSTERCIHDSNPLFQKLFILEKSIMAGEYKPWLNSSNVQQNIDTLYNLELKFAVFDVDPNDLFQNGDLLGQVVIPASSLLYSPRQDLRLADIHGSPVHQSVLTIQTQEIGIVKRAYLSITANGLPRSDWSAKCDPVAVAYAHNSFISKYCKLDQTERIRTNHSPIFRRLIPIDLYSLVDRNLRIAVYDTDSDESIHEKDILGECFINASELEKQAVKFYNSHQQYENSVLLSQARDGKHHIDMPPRPTIEPGVFIKLANPHDISISERRNLTAQLDEVEQKVHPATEAEVYVQLIYNKEEYQQALENGLMKHAVFSKKQMEIEKQQLLLKGGSIDDDELDADGNTRIKHKMLMAGQDETAFRSTDSTALVPVSSHPISAASPAVTEEVWQRVWAFTSSPDTVIFRDAKDGLQVTSRDLAALLEASRNLDGLMYHLNRFNGANRSFQNLAEIVPAIHLAIATNTHVTHDVWKELVQWLTSKQCRLFENSSSVQQYGLLVTLESLDNLIVVSNGLSKLRRHLELLNQVGRRFEQFDDLQPAILSAQKTGAHVEDAVWQAIRSYLSNRQCLLFRKNAGKKEAKLLQRQLELEQIEIAKGIKANAFKPVVPVSSKKRNALETDLADQTKFTSQVDQHKPLTNSGVATTRYEFDVDQKQMVVYQGNQSISLNPLPSDDKLVQPHPDNVSVNPNVVSGPSNAADLSQTVPSLTNPNGEFMLIHMNGEDVDKVMIASDANLSVLLLHLQRFDDVYRKFTNFNEIEPAILQAKQYKCYMGLKAMNECQNFINDFNRCQLFSTAPVQPTLVDGPVFDQIIHLTGSTTHLYEILGMLNSHARRFVRFQDLLEPIKAYVRIEGEEAQVDASRAKQATEEKQSLNTGKSLIEQLYPVPPSTYPKQPKELRKHVVDKLSSQYLNLFSDVIEFRITHQHLDALIYEAGTPQLLDQYLMDFYNQGRRFVNMDVLILAVSQASATNKPVDGAVWQTLFRFFTSVECNLFPAQKRHLHAGNTDGLFMTNSQINEMLTVPGGLPGLMLRLKHLNNEGMQFENVEQLVEEIRMRETFNIAKQHGMTNVNSLPRPPRDIAIDNTMRKAVIAQLSSRDSTLISTIKEVQMSKDDVDQMIYESYGLNQCLFHLRQFNVHKRSFGSIPELVYALRVAHHRGYHCSEADRQYLLQYLANPKVLLFSEARQLPIEIQGADIDQLLEVGEGLNNVLVHLRSMDRIGRRFQHFHEVPLAVRTAAKIDSYISPEDRQSIVKYLSSSSCQLFTESEIKEHVLQGHELDDLFLENRGKSAEDVLRALRKFDTLSRKFSHFHELSRALKKAFVSGCFCDDTVRQTIIGYLNAPNTHLLLNEHNAYVPPIKGMDLDELYISAGSSLSNLLAYLKQLNDLGKEYTHFADLIPQVNKLRTKEQRLKQEQLIRALSHLPVEDVNVIHLPLLKSGTVSNKPLALMPGSGAASPASAASPPTAKFNALAIGSSSNDIYQYDENQNYTALNPPRVSDEVFEQVVGHLTHKDCHLFDNAPSGILPNRAILDRLIWLSGGLNGLIQHLEIYDQVGRRFQSFADLLPALTRTEKSGIHVLEDDVTMIMDWFQSLENNIFTRESNLQYQSNILQIPGATIDALVIAASSTSLLLAHLRRYAEIHRQFSSMSDLIQGIQATKLTNCHASEDVRTAVLNRFYPSTPLAADKQMQLLQSTLPSKVPLLQPSVQLSGADIDSLLAVSMGLPALFVYLDALEQKQQQFPSVANLILAITHVRNNLNSDYTCSNHVWSSIISYITSSACHLFSNVRDGLKVDGGTLDTMLVRTGGLAQLIEKLKDLDNKNVKCKSFVDILNYIPAPLTSPHPLGVGVSPYSGSRLPVNSTTVLLEPTASSSTSGEDAYLLPTANSTTRTPQPIIRDGPPDEIHAKASENDQEFKFTSSNQPNSEAIDISEEQKQTIRNFFNSTQTSQLFPLFYVQPNKSDILSMMHVSDSELQTAIYESGGSVDSLVTHCHIFHSVGRQFHNWYELIIALRLVKETGSHVNEQIRIELLNYLSDPNVLLFSSLPESQNQLQVTSESIDTLISSAYGITNTLNHLRVFDLCGRTFNDFGELSLAVQLAIQQNRHIDAHQQAQLNNWLFDPNNKLFSPPLSSQPTIELTGLEYDRFYSCSQKRGFAGLLDHFEKFSIAQRTFASVTQLLVALERVVSGGSHIEEYQRESLVQFMMETRLFQDSQETDVQSADLDQIIFIAQGLEPAKQHLGQFDTVFRRFSSMNELIQSLKIAVARNCHLHEKDYDLLTALLTGVDSLIVDSSLISRIVNNECGMELNELVRLCGSAGVCATVLQALKIRQPQCATFAELFQIIIHMKQEMSIPTQQASTNSLSNASDNNQSVSAQNAVIPSNQSVDTSSPVLSSSTSVPAQSSSSAMSSSSTWSVGAASPSPQQAVLGAPLTSTVVTHVQPASDETTTTTSTHQDEATGAQITTTVTQTVSKGPALFWEETTITPITVQQSAPQNASDEL